MSTYYSRWASGNAHYSRVGNGLSCSGHDQNYDLVVLEFSVDVCTERVRGALRRGDMREMVKALSDAQITFSSLDTIGGYHRFAPLGRQLAETLARIEAICLRALLRRMLTGAIPPEQSEECLRLLSRKVSPEDVDREVAAIEAAAA